MVENMGSLDLSEQVNTEQIFEKKKTAFFSNFAVSNRRAFRPHLSQEGRTLGKITMDKEKNQWVKLGEGEVWRNVSEHCLVAGAFADILAEELHLPADQRKNVVQAAILHDWFKKQESMAQRKASKEDTLSLQTLSEVKSRDSRELKEMGVSEEIIELTGANIPKTQAGPETLPEKIIWYVDAMLSNTEPVPIRQRFDDLERGWDGSKEDPVRAERNNAFSNLYLDQYNGKSLYDVQRELGDKIGAEFAQKIGYEGETDLLPLYLRKKLEDRIRSYPI